MEMSDNLKKKVEKLKEAVDFMDDFFLELEGIMDNTSDHEVERFLVIDPWANTEYFTVKYTCWEPKREQFEIKIRKIPFIWLDEDYDYMSDWRKQLEEENRAKEEKRKREEDERDLKEYERLKKKFGNA